MKKWAVLFLLFGANVIWADSASDEVQKRLNAIQSMSATFDQVVKAGKRNVSKSFGDMAMSRPGRFRWHTKSPMAQLVVADGKKLWIYDVDLEQVTVRKQENGTGGTPALFLSGQSDTVARDFTVKKTGETYELHAKSAKENYQQVKLTFKGEQLSVIEFYDQLGQHTIVRLGNIKQNIKLAGSLFQFKPPKGVDVVHQ